LASTKMAFSSAVYISAEKRCSVCQLKIFMPV
jgi:hypothetical protein